MRRVRLYPDAIEDKDVQVAKPVHRTRRNYFQIGGIRIIIEAISYHRQLPMDDLNWCYLKTWTETKRGIRLNGMRYQLGQPSANVCWLEDILKDPPKVFPGHFVCIDAHSAESKVQRPYIVEAEDMVNVAMGDQNRVEMTNICSECLLAKVDRCVDQNTGVLVLDQYRNSKPFVTRVFG
jgi:hypothetical protein